MIQFEVFKMNFYMQQQKKSVASHIVSILRKLDLTGTAQILSEQSQLLTDTNLPQTIQTIIANDFLTTTEKQAEVRKVCQFAIKNYLRLGKLNEALQVYEEIVANYCPEKLDEYSMLFAENFQETQKYIENMQAPTGTKQLQLPQRKKYHLNLKKQIWHLRQFGASILALDCDSGATLIQYDNQQAFIKHTRQALHKGKIMTVDVKKDELFATGSDDKLVKVWSSKIDLLHTITQHQTLINCVTFFENHLASFDANGVISQHTIPNSSTEGVHSTMFKNSLTFNDVKYASKKQRMVGANFQQGRGDICLIEIDKKKVQKIIVTDKRIYSIEISKDQKAIFVNLASHEIHVYRFSKKGGLLHRLRGFKQENNLMRMSQGGRDGKYLAVTSEEGSVRIYNINEEEEILKIMGESKLSVNCVVFGGKNIWFACDQGLLECYVNF